MHKNGTVLSKSVAIRNELGLHARAAAKIAGITGHAAGNVWLSRDKKQVDAKSVLDILTLACSRGSRVTLSIEKTEDADILSETVKTIEQGFGE